MNILKTLFGQKTIKNNPIAYLLFFCFLYVFSGFAFGTSTRVEYIFPGTYCLDEFNNSNGNCESQFLNSYAHDTSTTPNQSEASQALKTDERFQKVLRRAKLEMCKAYFRSGINGSRLQNRLTTFGVNKMQPLAVFGLTAAIYYSVRAGFDNPALRPVFLNLRLYNNNYLAPLSFIGANILGLDFRYYFDFFVRIIDRIATKIAGTSVSNFIDDQTKIRTIADDLIKEAEHDCEKFHDPKGEFQSSEVAIDYNSLTCTTASEHIELVLSDSSATWKARLEARRGLSEFFKRADCSDIEKNHLRAISEEKLWIYEKSPEATYDALSLGSRVLGASLVSMLAVTSGPLVLSAALTGGLFLAGASYGTGYWTGEGYLGAGGLLVGTAFGALEAKLLISTVTARRLSAAAENAATQSLSRIRLSQ